MANDKNLTDDIVDLDAEIAEETIKNNVGKKTTAKKVTKKKVTAKKSSGKKVTKATKKTTKTNSKKTKSTKKNKKEYTTRLREPKDYEVSVSEELRKVTNTKSREQIKRPQRIIFMLCFYIVILLGILVFLIIKLSRPKKVDVLSNETTIEKYDEYLMDTTELKILTETIEPIEETTIEEEIETTKEVETKPQTTEEIEETTKKVEETTKKVEETTKAKEVETTKKIEESTAKKVEETTAKAVKKSGIEGLLANYRDVLYSYPVFYQFSIDEVGVIYKRIEAAYKAVSNRIFGSDVDFATKGVNGILYLNYMAVKDYLVSYNATQKENYKNLPKASYLEYIQNKKFNYSAENHTNDLIVYVEFKNAKDEGLYYDIPARFYEPFGLSVSSGGSKFVNLKVLKKSKVGFSQSFQLTAELEILDIECNTKNNPYFDIEDCIGPNPKAATMLTGSTFRIGEMLTNTRFNYITFDKKGYVAGLFMLQNS